MGSSKVPTPPEAPRSYLMARPLLSQRPAITSHVTSYAVGVHCSADATPRAVGVLPKEWQTSARLNIHHAVVR